MITWSKLLIISAFLFCLLPVSIPWVNAASDDVATVDLIEAEETFSSAYEVVLEAEQAGANVSGLLDKLNLGAEYLAEAYVWYRLGDSENTGHFAGLCYDVVGDVLSDAVELRDEAKRLEDANFFVTLFGSVVGVIVVVVLCSAVWRVFKRRYHQRVLGLMPEVASSES